MKKLTLVLALLSLLILSGCETEKNKEVTQFRNAITSFSIEETNGFLYNSTQYLNDEIINQDKIDKRIDWTDKKIYTEFYEKRLNNYDSNDTYGEKTYTTYYYNNQIGYQEADLTVNWKEGSLKDYLTDMLPVKTIYASYFKSFTVTTLEDGFELSGSLSRPSAVLKVDKNTAVDLKIRISNEQKIMYLDIIIKKDLTTIHITYDVYYDTQVVVIP